MFLITDVFVEESAVMDLDLFGKMPDGTLIRLSPELGGAVREDGRWVRDGDSKRSEVSLSEILADCIKLSREEVEVPIAVTVEKREKET